MNTQVELLWLEGQIERWIRFGAQAGERIIDRRRRLVEFRPGAVFALVRWRSGDYGTIESRIAILRAVSPGEGLTTYPYVAPGAEILLNLRVWRDNLDERRATIRMRIVSRSGMMIVAARHERKSFHLSERRSG